VAHTAFYLVGIQGFVPEVKQPGCEPGHSSPSSAEVKNEWSCTANPPYAFMAYIETP